MLIEEIKNIKSTKKELREFGLTVGIVFALIGGLFYWRGKDHYFYFVIVSFMLLILGLIAPLVLKPIQKIWMAVALIIGFVMTRIILCVLFYLVITPISLLGKLSGRDQLSLKFDRKASTYWIPRKKEKYNKANYEKQF